jgi:hypothetical protein
VLIIEEIFEGLKGLGAGDVWNVKILDDRSMLGIIVSRVGCEFRLKVGSEALSSFFLSLRPSVVCLWEGRGHGFIG